MKTMTTVEALNGALDLMMAENDKVFLMGEDIARMGGDFGVTRGLMAKYGVDRVRDTPISEAAIVGGAVGAARVGMRPVVEIMFADFLSECFDAIVNSAAKVNYMFNGRLTAPIVVRTATGGGFSGGPQSSQSVEGWFMNVPGLVIVAPSNPYDAKGLMISSIETDNPVLFLEHKALYRAKCEVPEEKYRVPLGKATVARAGTQVTIVTYMRLVREALAVADDLAQEGISVEVVDLRTLRPWDTETVLDSVAKTGRVVVASETPKMGGPASDVSAVIAEEGFGFLKAPIRRVCGLDTPIPFSIPLERVVLPGKDDIKAAVRKALV